MERIAVLRFENLGGDAPHDSTPDSTYDSANDSTHDLTNDWMGRAFSEIVTSELRGAPELYAIPAVRVHAVGAAMGPRPVTVPGISAERTAALAAGATKIVFGQYTVRGEKLEARMTVEDEIAGTMTALDPVTGPPSGIVSVASGLARQISAHVSPFGTKNPAVVETHVKAFEHLGSPGLAEELEKAVAVEPDFGPSYRQLAQIKLQQRDLAGAEEILGRGLARGTIPDAERALIQLEDANLRNDPGARSAALAALSVADPSNPEVWKDLGATSMATHRYPQAAEAYRKAAAIQPADPNLWNQLSYAAAYAGDGATAANAVDRYRKMMPESPDPADSLGDIQLIAGHLPQAEEAYLQNAKKHPEFYAGLDFLKAAMAHLMTGDGAGADALAQQYFANREAAHDPLTGYRKAQWAWISGRRKAACQQMEQLVHAAGSGPERAVAVHGYAELAVWTLMLGNREAASEIARQGSELAKPAATVQVALARFLTQPPASAAEWQARAKVLVPDPAQSAIGNMALADALLIAKEYSAALPVLRTMYDGGNPTADEGLPVLLAWANVENGHIPEAAELLRSNPPLPNTGLTWSTPLYFPRMFYLRAVVAEKQGKADVARENWQIFHALSGTDPLMWGEEAKGK